MTKAEDVPDFQVYCLNAGGGGLHSRARSEDEWNLQSLNRVGQILKWRPSLIPDICMMQKYLSKLLKPALSPLPLVPCAKVLGEQFGAEGARSMMCRNEKVTLYKFAHCL
eukprot:1155084-Pelagomonas_calceolata.AAC.2